MELGLILEADKLEELHVGSVSPQTDLKQLDSSLESQIEGGKPINDGATEIKDTTQNDRGIKRLNSTSSSSDSRDESVAPVKKLSSVLVRPDKHKHDKEKAELQRKAILESQRNDKQAFDRNKRMFGMLVGTLQRFKSEETHREKLTTIKRSKVEEKLDLNLEEEEEQEHVKQSKGESLDEADLKLDIVGRFKNWENTNTHLCGFIQTETRPKIFWLPKEHNSLTERRLKETKDYFSLCVAERAAKFKKELDDLKDHKTTQDNEH